MSTKSAAQFIYIFSTSDNNDQPFTVCGISIHIYCKKHYDDSVFKDRLTVHENKKATSEIMSTHCDYMQWRFEGKPQLLHT